MNDDQLDRNLRSIGKKCFVTFFEEFCDCTLSNRDVASKIARDMDCDYGAALTWRVNPARKIIEARRAADALTICSESRLPAQIKDKATILAAQLRETG